jgi:hypothetical protein
MMIMNFIIPYLNTVILQIERDICYFLIWFKNWAFLRHDGVKRFNRIGYHSEDIVVHYVNYGHTGCDTTQSYDLHQRFEGVAASVFPMKLHSLSYAEAGGYCTLYPWLTLPSTPTSLCVSSYDQYTACNLPQLLTYTPGINFSPWWLSKHATHWA